MKKIDKFIKQLAATRDLAILWSVNAGGCIRGCRIESIGGNFCPITAVQFQVNRTHHLTTEFLSCAKDLGFGAYIANEIVNAADCKKGRHDKNLRRRLLRACGLLKKKVK